MHKVNPLNTSWLALLLLCCSLSQCALGPSFERGKCFMEGEGYEQRDHQIHYWVITDLPGIEDRDAGVVKDALYESFRPLDNVKDSNPECSQKYGKDAAHVFYRGHVIEGADLSTFEIIQSDYSLYSKDKGAVYFGGKRISNRVQQFRILGSPWYATDGEQAFYYGKLIGAGNLELVPGNEGLAKTDTQIFHDGELVQNAAPTGYTRHGQGCLWEFATDSTHVFLDNKPVPGADPQTFTELGNCSTIYRDKRMIYIWNRELPEVHRDSARAYGPFYLVDDSAVYRILQHTLSYVGGIERMEERDAASFQVLAGAWTKDRNGVYYNDKKLPEADPVSFHMAKNVVYHTGEDKNYRYLEGRISCKFGEKSSDNIPRCPQNAK